MQHLIRKINIISADSFNIFLSQHCTLPSALHHWLSTTNNSKSTPSQVLTSWFHFNWVFSHLLQWVPRLHLTHAHQISHHSTASYPFSSCCCFCRHRQYYEIVIIIRLTTIRLISNFVLIKSVIRHSTVKPMNGTRQQLHRSTKLNFYIIFRFLVAHTHPYSSRFIQILWLLFAGFSLSGYGFYDLFLKRTKKKEKEKTDSWSAYEM